MANAARDEEPLSENFPEADPRHNALVPFFEVMKKFELLAEEYPTLSIEWSAEDGKWISWPPPSRAIREGEECPSSPGSDLHIETSAGEANRRLLEPPESWFDSTRDPWLDIKGTAPSERWLYAIREFWLRAGEEAEEAGTDIDEFAKVAETEGYWHTHSPHAVGERIWRKMIRSKLALNDSRQELGLSAADEVDKYEEPAGWVQTGSIKDVFRACVYFCGVLAARRALVSRLPSRPMKLELIHESPRLRSDSRQAQFLLNSAWASRALISSAVFQRVGTPSPVALSIKGRGQISMRRSVGSRGKSRY